MKKREFSWTFLFAVLMIGAIIGGVIGQFLASLVPATAPYLTKGIEISMQNTTLDLYFLKVPLGFVFKFNLVSVIGVVLAFYLLRKF